MALSEFAYACKVYASNQGWSGSTGNGGTGHVQALNFVAGTTNWPVVGCLNKIAGNATKNYRELEGVINQLAGTTQWGENAAASRWAGLI